MDNETPTPEELQYMRDMQAWAVRRAFADSVLLMAAQEEGDWRTITGAIHDLELCVQTIKRTLQWNVEEIAELGSQGPAVIWEESMKMSIDFNNRHDELGLAPRSQVEELSSKADDIIANRLGDEATRMLRELEN